ncbi:MAG: 1-aminocyclopropane-1-carboxylate deaminase/D-cysteine desulfhydrase [Gammaproteobacteria bacterium]
MGFESRPQRQGITDLTVKSSFPWEALKALPRQSFIDSPTPLLPLRKLGQALGGLEIWCKRDDLIGFGVGGNKIRGLELMTADALAKRADVLVTGAGAQSNHVRATAAAAAYLGLKCVGVFWGKPPLQNDGNFRITRTLGAETVFTGDDDRASVDAGILMQSDALRRRGKRPYAIPRGGACALGALGHTLAAREFHEQCRRLGIVPGKVVLATGSGGTHAGWLLGNRALGCPWKIESYTVSRGAEEVRTQIVRLAEEAASLIGLDWRFAEDDVVVHGGFIGDGYGIPSREGAEAIRLLARTEGILLDPTYTGKAMAGLLAQQRSEPAREEPIVFIHTGGQPAFFAGDGKWLAFDDKHSTTI